VEDLMATKDHHKRGAVSEGLTSGTYTRPAGATTTKDQATTDKILKAVQYNVLFTNLDADIKAKVVAEMHSDNLSVGQTCIKQGDSGDMFYVIASGEFDISVDGKVVATYKDGQCFGELALMYNAPRAATVSASKVSQVWMIHRLTYRKIVKAEFNKNLDQNHAFLMKVDMLKGLSGDQKQSLAEALERVEYKAGDVIFEQGSVGLSMYIVRSGKIVIYKDGINVMELGDGGCFGERALVTKEPRAATAKAETAVELLQIDKSTFDMLLGPLNSILNTIVQSYDAGSSGGSPRASGEIKKPEAVAEAHATIEKIPFENLEIIGTLGNGSFGHVQLVKNKLNQDQTFALKAVSKAQIVETGQQGHIMSEKNVMAQLNHPFLIRLYQTYKDKDRLYFLLEPVLGGELFTLLKEHEVFTEEQARFYAGCVILAFEYMHSFDIVYRDLKPENLLIDSDGYIKITDFGFAKKIDSGRTWTLCGTPDYLAPEIVAGRGHGKGVDWWTLGILIYEMLCSAPPFYDKDQLKTYQKIMGGEVIFPAYFSQFAISLIKKLLYRKATRRLGVVKGGASLIKKHKWFREFHLDKESGKDGWKQLFNRQIKPTIIPKIASKFDLSNFEEAFDEDEGCEPYQDDGSEWDKDF